MQALLVSNGNPAIAADWTFETESINAMNQLLVINQYSMGG
jgi:hypothetical protein